MSKIGLVWRTVQHLRPRQVLYQIVNRLRRRPVLRLPDAVPTGYFLKVPDADKPVSYAADTFIFLNQPVTFSSGIDWNYAANGKLWIYNLNYFDYLNQPNLPLHEGQMLMLDFITQTNLLHDGLEPYPTSLRIINWVQFLSRYQLQDEIINAHLFAQINLLSRRLEYHLSGNHLLENGFALLTGALYFRHKNWFQTATSLIRNELTTQILADGGHDERSPMYHQILLDRLLDVLLALHSGSWQNDHALLDFLSGKATQMLDWLNAVTFANGDVPMINDAAFGIAPTTAQILAKMDRVRLAAGTGAESNSQTQLTESGYRRFRFPRYELLADAGAVGPDHQPGHAHADTFSFVLYVDNRPVIVDSGTSTYQVGIRRTWERSTAAHNTVAVGGLNSSEVWGGFRVGRRARTTVLVDTETTLSARHNGYRHMGITHQRTWQVQPDGIEIEDRVIQKANAKAPGQLPVARFYVHPDVPVVLADNYVTIGAVRLTFSSNTRLTLALKPCSIADGFNRLRWGQCLAVTFANYLKTSVTIAV